MVGTEGKWGAGLESCPRDARAEHSRWRCGDHTAEGTQAGVQICSRECWSVLRA